MGPSICVYALHMWALSVARFLRSSKIRPHYKGTNGPMNVSIAVEVAASIADGVTVIAVEAVLNNKQPDDSK